MSMPFYVSPEQQMQDRAEFARKGISRGRAVVAMCCADGIVLVADNPSSTLRKISEIYDRIAFGAVGRYNEFEQLRLHGIQQADLRGYSYDRRDVTARTLAGQYSQVLGGTFASGAAKPFEVELVIAELGVRREKDLLFHISYDGTIAESTSVVALGRRAELLAADIAGHLQPETPVAEAVAVATRAMGGGEDPTWEVGLLDRTSQQRRTFRRVEPHTLQEWIAS